MERAGHRGGRQSTMKHRRVIMRVAVPTERGVPAVLQRAAEQLRAALDAEVVFASAMNENGVLNCLGVAPIDMARLAPVSLGTFPERAAVLDDARRALFARSYECPVEHTVVSVPVGNGGFRALVTAVLAETPDGRTLAMMDAWAGLLGECIDGERTREALEVRDSTIRQLREVLDVAFSLTSEAVVAIDLDGRVIRWNRGCERLYGWSAEQAVGSQLPMVSPERLATVLSRVRLLADEGTITRTPGIVHHDIDGRELLIHATMLPLLDEDGDVYGAVSVMQEESPAAIIDSRATSPAVSEAALARLTAPVTAVSGFVQLLQRSDALNDPGVRERVLRGLERRCREIADISEELRLATHLLGSEPSLCLAPEDPCSALRRALDRSVEAGSDRIVVDATEGLTLHVDAGCLEGAVTGLLRGLLRCNAEDVRITAAIRLEPEGVALVFNATADERVGALDHPESALGMHLARLCAQAHGGEFAISSERDVTEIRLLMPVGTAVN